jgi:hypothetical protein
MLNEQEIHLKDKTDFQDKIMIFESFQFEKIDKKYRNYDQIFCKDPYSFCVLLNPRYISQKNYKTIKNIVESEKPAHTVGNVFLLQPWFVVGAHTFLGVNTILGKRTFTVGKSIIGRDTELTSEDGSGQIGNQSRIGVDLILS